MGYMKSDIDKRLLYIILIVGGVLVLLTIIYQTSLGKINSDKGDLETQIDHLTNNMSVTMDRLSICQNQVLNLSWEINETKSFLEESRSEYNAIYEETEGELEKTEEELLSKEDQLTKVRDQNKQYLNEIAVKNNQISSLENENDELRSDNGKLEAFKEDANDFIDDFEHCRDSDNTVACYNDIKIPD